MIFALLFFYKYFPAGLKKILQKKDIKKGAALIQCHPPLSSFDETF
jgi:hypothetical protein